MLTYEQLKEEMKKRGCNLQQVESRLTRIILDILTENGTTLTDAFDVEKKAQTKMNEAGEMEARVLRRENSLKEQKEELLKKQERIWQYISDFQKALGECETKEGRDMMRRAQVFINTVNIETSQNNTAFIEALGRIMSEGEVGSLKAFEQITAEKPGKTVIRK